MVWVLVAVGAATAAVLLVLVVGLFRHLRAMATALQRLQADLSPLLEDIQRGSEEAQRKVADLQARAAAVRRDRG
jgi:Tfp pilus assembly protein PilN